MLFVLFCFSEQVDHHHAIMTVNALLFEVELLLRNAFSVTPEHTCPIDSLRRFIIEITKNKI